MFCCGNCFSDRFLKGFINTATTNLNDCSFCDSKSQKVIDPRELSDLFQPVVDLYTETTEEGGRSLVELLKGDWCLFDKIEEDKAIDLLNSIYTDANFQSKKFSPKAIPDSTRIKRWNDFREELKHINRFFPKQIQQDIDQLTSLIKYLALPSNESPNVMYRARRNTKKTLYSIEEMEKPPCKLVEGGRANPIGIPYFYTASTAKTAIAEIRPHKSDTVSVAKVNVLKGLNLADLREPRKTISPFELTESELSHLYPDIEYLCRLGEELEKPILPYDANLEYLPTQYLCEFIKHIEINDFENIEKYQFDGVMYNSSVGDGINYAIFNDAKIDIVSVDLYEITEVSIKSRLKSS